MDCHQTPYCAKHMSTKTMVLAFIITRLDSGNVVYYGIRHDLMHHLQLIQNAAAQLVTGTWRS